MKLVRFNYSHWNSEKKREKAPDGPSWAAGGALDFPDAWEAPAGHSRTCAIHSHLPSHLSHKP